ncbi:Ankyrin repeat family protein isoform 3 [Hibiscus syriacus]|uniref:Ankyrin repeat family protein isoform 3 n=1 Tax=Hibiscus syriacus TaxID=106335 RepID=A0A6A2XUK0_HIBSY|nr:poly [ADP-ribose] polymerase tankyrase-2-like [Hibiscus syriacus]KAE8657734.1 Ankyrin repeat family protein isoform 3 [Hibiscus syriacus]
MAVPGRHMFEEDEDDDNALFEENGLEIDLEADTPPHLRDLVAAVQLGDLNALRLALDNLNGNIDEPAEDGDTALHLACLYGYLPCVQILLERGANLEAKDEDGAVPLHDACAGGFVEIVQLLLDRATDSGCLKRILDSVDAEGDTPLHHAARGEHAEVIRLLLAKGASPTKTNTYGKIPQELADPETEAWRVFEAATSAQTSQGSC